MSEPAFFVGCVVEIQTEPFVAAPLVTKPQFFVILDDSALRWAYGMGTASKLAWRERQPAAAGRSPKQKA